MEKDIPQKSTDRRKIRRTDNQVSFTSPARTAASLIIGMTKEDSSREGLLKTPQRFSSAYKHLLSGYDTDAKGSVGEGIFDAEGAGLVSVDEVEFYSMCEHHLLPFWGTANVAYFPHKKILGLSKIPRLLDTFARRIQVQERITEQLVTAMVELLEPRAVLVQVKAQHLCMMMRGVEKQSSATFTEKVYGFSQLQDFEQQQFLKLMGRRH